MTQYTMWLLKVSKMKQFKKKKISNLFQTNVLVKIQQQNYYQIN